MISLSQSQLKEKEVFEYYKKNNPDVLVAPSFSEKEVFSRIGINISLSDRPQGYLRFHLQDFIVEEVLENREISEIEPRKNFISSLPVPFTLYANLVKTGISTPDAINFIADYLEIKSNKIGHAGLKDVKALTSQRIAFPNINLEILEKIKEISSPKFFLTNFILGKGSINPGQLFGNRFTIFIRTKEKADEKWLSQYSYRLGKQGFLNFYHIQRFGTPRFLSHFFGKLIFQGKYKETILAFLTMPGLKEIPLIKDRRQEARTFFEDWEKMEKIFEEFPYTFRNEIRLLSYLKQNPKNFIGALIFFRDQTTLWVYAYTSYLFNLVLSLKEIELPEKIPILSEDLRDQKIYEFWLEKDEIENFKKNLFPFKFIKSKRRFVKTKVFPKNVLFKILPEGVILSFILEKGVYATTFLMNFFEISQGLPLPEWVDTQESDIKDILGIGSVKEVKKILGESTLLGISEDKIKEGKN